MGAGAMRRSPIQSKSSSNDRAWIQTDAAIVVFKSQADDGRVIKFPAVMGVLNVTPDSFSDGGRYLDPDRAVEHALEMEAAGADVIDVGGESSRPVGAGEISVEDELARVMPVLDAAG